MNNSLFMIVVNGQLVEGATREQAQANIAKLFKTTPEKVAPMFAGNPVTIKKGLDKKGAAQYLATLKQAGMVAKAVPLSSETPAATPTAQATATKPSATPQPPKAEPASTKTGSTEFTVAPVGSDVTDYEPVPEPEIDISKLSMAKAGEDIMEHKPVPEPEFDTSKFKLEEK